MRDEKEDTIVIENKQNYGDFKDFYIGVVVEADGREGLIAKLTEGLNGIPVIQPMMGGTESDRKAVLKYADTVARVTGKTVKVIKYNNREVIKTVVNNKAH